MTAEQTGEIFRMVLAGWPTQRQRMSDGDVAAMAALWLAALADLDFAQCKAAIVRIVKTSKFIPSIAEIREEIGVVVGGVRRPGIDAWGEVLRMSTYREEPALADFDPLVVKVCQSLGWLKRRTLWRGNENISQWMVSPGGDEASDRARFVEAYDKLTAIERREAQVAPGAQLPPAPEVSKLVGSVARKLSAKPEALDRCVCSHNRALHFIGKDRDGCSHCACAKFSAAGKLAEPDDEPDHGDPRDSW